MFNFVATTHISEQNIFRCEAAWKNLILRKDIGFLQAPFRSEYSENSIRHAQRLKNKSDYLVVVGLGGSSLGAKCLVKAIGIESNIIFLSDSDPLSVGRILKDPALIAKAQFLFISKSGGTLELACILDLLVVELKNSGRLLQDAISVITENTKNGLRIWAIKNDVTILDHPLDVGGRFSVFTSVGLVPAVFSGVDVTQVLAGAKKIHDHHELIVRLSAFYLDSFLRGEFLSVFWMYCEKLQTFSDWLIQLWAESLAKSMTRTGGEAPRVSTPLAYAGATDQHSVLQQLMEGAKDKSIGFFRVQSAKNCDLRLSGESMEGFTYLANQTLNEVFKIQSHATQEALSKVGRTTYSLEIEELSPQALGELLMAFQLVVSVIGEVLNINAFDQPGVELGKKITKEKLQKNSRL